MDVIQATNWDGEEVNTLGTFKYVAQDLTKLSEKGLKIYQCSEGALKSEGVTYTRIKDLLPIETSNILVPGSARINQVPKDVREAPVKIDSALWDVWRDLTVREKYLPWRHKILADIEVQWKVLYLIDYMASNLMMKRDFRGLDTLMKTSKRFIHIWKNLDHLEEEAKKKEEQIKEQVKGIQDLTASLINQEGDIHVPMQNL